MDRSGPPCLRGLRDSGVAGRVRVCPPRARNRPQCAAAKTTPFLFRRALPSRAGQRSSSGASAATGHAPRRIVQAPHLPRPESETGGCARHGEVRLAFLSTFLHVRRVTYMKHWRQWLQLLVAMRHGCCSYCLQPSGEALKARLEVPSKLLPRMIAGILYSACDTGQLDRDTCDVHTVIFAP
jgi:hypothetical protein